MYKGKCYVTMTDKFMSGWGQARGKINKLVISCNSREEANTVYRYATNRYEMRYVNIASNKPYYNPKKYLVSWHGRDQDDYSSWFF